MAENGNGDFSFGNIGGAENGRNGLAKIQTTSKHKSGICHDDSAAPVKAQTIDELHSLQKKKSAPTTPKKAEQGDFAIASDEERQKQQLQSIRLLTGIDSNRGSLEKHRSNTHQQELSKCKIERKNKVWSFSPFHHPNRSVEDRLL